MSAKQTSLPIPTRATSGACLGQFATANPRSLQERTLRESQEPLPVDDINAYPTGRISSTKWRLILPLGAAASNRGALTSPSVSRMSGPTADPDHHSHCPLSQFHTVATIILFPEEWRPGAVVRESVWRQTQLSR